MAKRVPDSVIANDYVQDGNTLTAEQINILATVFKAGINANWEAIKSQETFYNVETLPTEEELAYDSVNNEYPLDGNYYRYNGNLYVVQEDTIILLRKEIILDAFADLPTLVTYVSTNYATLEGNIYYKTSFDYNGSVGVIPVTFWLDKDEQYFFVAFNEGLYKYTDTGGRQANTIVIYGSDGNEHNLYWDNDQKTLTFNVDGTVTLEVNQEIVFNSKASGNINNGYPVFFVEPQGDHALTKQATASDIIANPYGLRGIATQAANAGSFFKTTQLGRVNGINTTAWATENGGTTLYFDITESGTGAYNMTTIAPTKPNQVIKMGSIEKWSTGGSANGRIIVRIDYGESLGTLHDVDLTGVATGDILRKTNGTWTPTSDLTDLEARTTVVESDITKIENGTIVVGESVYASKDKSERNLVDLVHKTRTIIGIDLVDNILLGEFKTALGNATESVAGLMSETDKARLNALHALLNEGSANDVVDAINEILAIFENYPEGADLVTVLASKVDKVSGKGLSANDYSDAEKDKVSVAKAHADVVNGTNPHATTFENIVDKPTTVAGYGIVDVYTKEYIDALKDMNGWESELITTTPLTNGETVALGTLQAFDVIKLFARNMATNEIDTDSFDADIGTVVGYAYHLFDNANIKLTIGTPNCTFTDTVGGYELRIVGQKYSELSASEVSYDKTGSTLKSTTVQGAIDEHDREIEELKYAPVVERTMGERIESTLGDFVPNDNGKPLLKEVNGMQVYAPQLITNGDFSSGTTGWTAYRGTGTVTNGVYTLVGNTADNYMALYRDITVNTTDKYYIFSMLMTPNTVNYLQVTNVGIVYSPTPNLWYLFSGIFTFSTTQGRHECLLNYTPINGLTLNIKNNIRINISTLIANKQYSPIYNTTFDLMSDAQIKAQMDAWVQEGILPNANLQAVTNTKIKSVGKNLFDKSQSIVNGYFDSGSVVSGGSSYCSDFILVKPSTAYVVSPNAQRIASYRFDKSYIGATSVGVTTITTASDCYYIRIQRGFSDWTTTQLEQGSTATTYAPYKSSTLELTHTPLYRLPNGVKDIVRYDNGQYVKDKYVQEYTLQESDIQGMTTRTNVDEAYTKTFDGLMVTIASPSLVPNHLFSQGRFSVAYNDGDNLAYIGQITQQANNTRVRFILAKGTTLAQAQTALAGTKIYYQLATPLLANELVNADGQLIQENPTTLIQEQTLNTEYDIDFTIDTKKQVVTNMTNVALKADKTYVDSQDLTKADKVVLTNLIANGDFALSSNWTSYYNAAITYNSGRLNVVKDAAIGISQIRQAKVMNINTTDKYYAYVKLQSASLLQHIYISGYPTTNLSKINLNLDISNETAISFIGSFDTAVTTAHIGIGVSTNGAIGTDYFIDNFILVNLTATFGAGNEPTKEQMDAIMTLKGGYFSTATINVIDVMKLFAPKTQEAWLTPTLTNSWTNVSGATVQYMKDNFGVVRFKGRMTGGATGSVAFTLPSGYFPTYPTSQIVSQNSDGAFARISNSGAGGSIVVSFGGTLSSWVDLSGIILKV